MMSTKYMQSWGLGEWQQREEGTQQEAVEGRVLGGGMVAMLCSREKQKALQKISYTTTKLFSLFYGPVPFIVWAFIIHNRFLKLEGRGH